MKLKKMIALLLAAAMVLALCACGAQNVAPANNGNNANEASVPAEESVTAAIAGLPGEHTEQTSAPAAPGGAAPDPADPSAASPPDRALSSILPRLYRSVLPSVSPPKSCSGAA